MNDQSRDDACIAVVDRWLREQVASLWGLEPIRRTHGGGTEYWLIKGEAVGRAVLGVSEHALKQSQPTDLVFALTRAGWADRLLEESPPGLLLRLDGSLEPWWPDEIDPL